MEKVNRIVVSKKEQKKLGELERLLGLLGYDLSKIDEIKEENTALKAKVEALGRAVEDLADEIKDGEKKNHEYIVEKLKEIATNLHNETAKAAEKNQQAIQTYLFKGSKINEDI